MSDKLTRENYFERDNAIKYMGASQFKAFEKCAAAALAEIRGEHARTESKALLQGQYLDSFFDGSRELFEAQHSVLKKNGEPYAEYAATLEAVARIHKDPVMLHLCQGGEQQVAMTGEIEGVPVKILIDSLHQDMIVDRKFMRDFNNVYVDGQWMTFAAAWGYDIQGYIYQTIVEQNIGEKLPFVIAGVTKEPEPDIGAFLMSENTLVNAGGAVRASIQDYQNMKQGGANAWRCEDCAYCRKTKQLSSNRKEWAVL